MGKHSYSFAARVGVVLALVCSAAISIPNDALAAGTYPNRDAAVIVDGTNGRILYERNASVRRYPASLTKMMTLYLLFEALDNGTLSLGTPIVASAHAASQTPTKLYIDRGKSIPVQTAIEALVILSANDVAVMVAEALGGTEDNFARLMTQKARDLGMAHTTFRNASGLPDSEMLTTALDMALLARHLAYDFPDSYRYFALKGFNYGGRYYRTHNNVMGQFRGTDGIKTGYTRRAGFNLVSSVVRNNKHIIGVVMGGRTAASRDQEMVRLLADTFYRIGRMPYLAANANVPWRDDDGLKTVPTWGEPISWQVALAASPPENAIVPITKPRRPLMLASLDTDRSVEALLADLSKMGVGPVDSIAALIELETFEDVGVDGSTSVPASQIAVALPAPKPAQFAALQTRGAVIEEGDVSGISLPVLENPSVRQWIIQIGAFGTPAAAQAQLALYAERSMDVLGQARRLVVPFSPVNGNELYRARFGLFAEGEAREACRRIMQRGETCFTARQTF